MNDDDLSRRAVKGDEAAATELVVIHYERLYAWFRRLVGNEEDAADLTQKTFIRVWPALPSFRGQSTFATWLHGIGRHVYLDWRRQHKPTEPLDGPWWAEEEMNGPSPSEAAADRELSHQVYGLVEQLDEETRQTVHLHYYQDLSLAETAVVLGVATSTVKYRLRQALQFIRLRLEAAKQT